MIMPNVLLANVVEVGIASEMSAGLASPVFAIAQDDSNMQIRHSATAGMMPVNFKKTTEQ